MLMMSYAPSQSVVSHMATDDSFLLHGRPRLRAICEAMTHFRDLSPTMPVGEVLMFLLVSLNEGASLTDLAELADMKKSTASRYLLDLSDKTRAGDAGLGLITRDADPSELRKNMYALTSRGTEILRKLLTANDRNS